MTAMNRERRAFERVADSFGNIIPAGETFTAYFDGRWGVDHRGGWGELVWDDPDTWAAVLA